jgi:glucose/arabinose dehydrogenase
MPVRFLVVVICAALGCLPAPAWQSLPAGFEVRPFVTGLDQPVALDFAPDGRLFITEKEGRVRVAAADGALQSEPFAEIEVYTNNECGLLGLAIGPDFANSGHVYIFASVSFQEQQILRFSDEQGVGVNPMVVRDHLPGSESVHAGGCLKIGPDGRLYFSIGDTGSPYLAQDLSSLAGSVCRVELDGSPSDDNPFMTPTGSPRAVYAYGFRNPFRFCFAPDGRLFVMDVGSSQDKRREEINLVGAGDNCGWPMTEGRGAAADFPEFVAPLYDYHDQGAAIGGGVCYAGAQFPDEYQRNVFHVEYVLHRIYRTVLQGDRAASHELFYQAQGGPVDMVQGPDGALYYTELFGGRVMRIGYAGMAAEPTPDGAPHTLVPSAAGGPCGSSALAVAAILAPLTLAGRERRFRFKKGVGPAA